MNAGAVSDSDGVVRYVDVVLSNRSAYAPLNASLNAIHADAFAQINLACNQEVALRAATLLSCADAPSCKRCEQPSFGAAARAQCYAEGCACYSTLVHDAAACSGGAKAAARRAYSCGRMETAVVLPGGVMTTMTAYALPPHEHARRMRHEHMSA